MAINTTLESASTTAASNGPSGSDQRTLADDGLRQYLAFIKSLKTLAVLASATTVTPPSTANAFSVTGTTAITTIASTNSWDGRDILFIFAGILTLTNGSNLILPGSANITTAVGDAAWLVQVASGQWRVVGYSRADGSWLVGTQSSLTLTGNLTVNGNTTLGDAAGDALTVSPSAVTWSNNPTHSGNHTYTGNVTVNGNTVLGNAGTDTITTTGNVALNAATAGNTLTVTQGASAGFVLTGAIAGGTLDSNIINTSAAANSDARHLIQVASGASGDPFNLYAVGATTFAAVGLDNSDSDAYKISFSTALGSGNSLVLTADGRLYGTALHNNAGAVTGTTNQYIASGTYTPTLTNTTNVASSSFTDAGTTKWIRVGNVVTVSGGNLNISPTAAAGAQTVLDLSLPIASILGLASACAGTASDGGGPNAGTANTSAAIQGSTANNRAQIFFEANNTNSQPWWFTFTYTVL